MAFLPTEQRKNKDNNQKVQISFAKQPIIVPKGTSSSLIRLSLLAAKYEHHNRTYDYPGRYWFPENEKGEKYGKYNAQLYGWARPSTVSAIY